MLRGSLEGIDLPVAVVLSGVFSGSMGEGIDTASPKDNSVGSEGLERQQFGGYRMPRDFNHTPLAVAMRFQGVT